MKASAPRTNDWTISSDWVTNSSRRLSERSAITPAHAESRRIGPNWHAVSSPTTKPLSVSLRTSSVSATIVSQFPVFEIS